MHLSCGFFCVYVLLSRSLVTLHCEDRFDLSRCDALNTFFIPEVRGERHESPSARSLIKLIMCELLYEAASPHPSLPLSHTHFFYSVSICVIVLLHCTNLQKLVSLHLGDLQMSSLFSPVGSSNIL